MRTFVMTVLTVVAVICACVGGIMIWAVDVLHAADGASDIIYPGLVASGYAGGFGAAACLVGGVRAWVVKRRFSDWRFLAWGFMPAYVSVTWVALIPIYAVLDQSAYG